MKKVTQVLYSGLGGHGSVAFSIAEGDREKKTEQSFVFFGIELVLKDYISKCEKDSIHYTAIVINNMSKVKALYRAYMAIMKQKPDTVILHSIALFPIVPILRLLGVRVISVDHTPNATKKSGEWFAVKVLRWFSNYQIYLTQNQLDDYKHHFGERFYRIGTPIVIPNGIDTFKYVPLRAYNEKRPLKLMMQARFSYTKDFQTLIRAVHILKSEFFQEDFQVFLAGNGETWEDCIKLSKELQVTDYITFLGMLPEKEVIENLQNTQLYIHSSLSETMSTAIMQALSCGLPCLVSDIPGNQSIIKDGENGWLFETQNELDLAEKIRLFINGSLDAAEMSRKARTYAEENLSMEKMFDSYYKLIQ